MAKREVVKSPNNKKWIWWVIGIAVIIILLLIIFSVLSSMQGARYSPAARTGLQQGGNIPQETSWGSCLFWATICAFQTGTLDVSCHEACLCTHGCAPSQGFSCQEVCAQCQIEDPDDYAQFCSNGQQGQDIGISQG